MRPRKLILPQFISWTQVRTGKTPQDHNSDKRQWIDVSSYADDPWNQLSPMIAHGGIPVPGMPGTSSDSVEGIWQGLKVIRGQTAPRYFHGMGKKRGGKPMGHKFGVEKRLLSLEQARRRIYIPAYRYMIEHCVDKKLIDHILSQAFRGIPQFFYDREDNASISKDRPLAHASVLVSILRSLIEQKCAAKS